MIRFNAYWLRPGYVLLSAALCCSAACDEKAPSTTEHHISEQGTTLPVLSQVPKFSLTDEEGRAFGSRQLEGAPYLAAFMFTRCPTICPELTARMRQVRDAVLAENANLQLVSISVDPENDTPAVLKAYAKKHQADHPNWAFLTGDYKTIAETSEQGFKVGLSGKADESKPDLGITHGSHLVLVDANGNIRGYFRSSDDKSVNEIVAALKNL